MAENFRIQGGITFPDGTEQTTAGGGGNALDPYVTIQEGNVQVTTNLQFSGETFGAFITVEGNQDFDVHFQEATGDSDGVTYAAGRTQENDGYAIVYAFNANGTVKWKASFSQERQEWAPYPSCITVKNSFVYVGFYYYDDTDDRDYIGVVKLNATTGAKVTDWILDTDIDTSPNLHDIDVDDDGNPIIVSRVYNEFKTISDVAVQTGSGINVVMVDISDLDGEVPQSGDGSRWQVETSTGVFSYPDFVNTAFNLPVTNLTNPSVTGMTVFFRYDQNQSNYWAGGILTDPGGYTNGDQLKVPGSLLRGIDGVNDATWTFNGGVLNGLAGTPSDALKATATFAWYSGGSVNKDFTPPSTANIKVALYSNALIWTPNWHNSYGTGSSEEFYGVTYDSYDDSIYVVGNFGVYNTSPNHQGMITKLNASTGATIYQSFIEDDTGPSSLKTVCADGNGNIFIIGNNDNGYAFVSKVSGSDLAPGWQVRQTNHNNWNDGNGVRGALDDSGNFIYITGINTDNSPYVVSIMKLATSSGDFQAAYTITNEEEYDFYDMNDEETQTTNIIGNNIFWGGYTYDSNGSNDIGFAIRLPIDGTGTGTYGRWTYSADNDVAWETSTYSSYDTTYDPVDDIAINSGNYHVDVTVGEVGAATVTVETFGTGASIKQVDSIVFSDGTTQNTAIAGGPISWTNTDSSNVWRIETYNGGTYVNYNGGLGEIWWDAANSPSGNSDFRGAIIEYHALTNYGTIIGTIHVAQDNNITSTATHSENLKGNSDLNLVTLWESLGNDGQLYFSRTDNGNDWLAIQWTSKIFYGADYYC